MCACVCMCVHACALSCVTKLGGMEIRCCQKVFRKWPGAGSPYTVSSGTVSPRMIYGSLPATSNDAGQWFCECVDVDNREDQKRPHQVLTSLNIFDQGNGTHTVNIIIKYGLAKFVWFFSIRWL